MSNTSQTQNLDVNRKPNSTDSSYEDLLKKIMLEGKEKSDRTGTGAKSIFGAQLIYDLKNGFPLITTKKVFVKAVILELLWFLRGDSNVRWLQERGCTIWDEWADENGDLGPVYGAQWRSWPTPDGGHIDQISEAVRLLKDDPDSRRIIVSAWNVADLHKMAIMPCHALFQFYSAINQSTGRRELSCQLYQRSADMFLGVPFNIASYALLTHMVARECDMDVGDFIWAGGDCHIYSNHMEQVSLQLSRTPKPFPELRFRNEKPPTIFDYDIDDFTFDGYDPHPPIKAPVAV